MLDETVGNNDDDDLARLMGAGKGEDDDEDEVDEVLGEDARKELRQTHVDLMNEAEAEGTMAQEHEKGCPDFMKCDFLDDPPEITWDVFSAVLGDPFHGMSRPRVPTKHECKKPFCLASMKAWLAFDPAK